MKGGKYGKEQTVVATDKSDLFGMCHVFSHELKH